MKIGLLVILFLICSLQGISQFENIKNQLQAHNVAIDSLTDLLILAVSDTNQSEKVQKKTIDLLVEINTNKSLHFLIQNLSKVYFPNSFKGADSEFMGYYIFHSLTIKFTGNWRLLPIIFHSLNSAKSDTEITLISILLHQVLIKREFVFDVLNVYLPKAAGLMKYNLIRVQQTF